MENTIYAEFRKLGCPWDINAYVKLKSVRLLAKTFTGKMLIFCLTEPPVVGPNMNYIEQDDGTA
jgi:hypothetical protein